MCVLRMSGSDAQSCKAIVSVDESWTQIQRIEFENRVGCANVSVELEWKVEWEVFVDSLCEVTLAGKRGGWFLLCLSFTSSHYNQML